MALCTSRTITEISGAGMKTRSFWVSSARSSIGVRPLAWMSLIKGSEMAPSGRTGTVRLIASFFHTEISITSSGPIR